ncbi:MAG: WbqC family protein [Flavobacteriaceae bacterium]|nr:WbqC family protein [Flavobacteriaceae bacterium]
MKNILLHPSYFPSVVHMAAMIQADKVVFEIEDNYQKQSYRTRTYIAHSNGVLLLNIPIKHSTNGIKLKTKEVLIENAFPWQIQHWKSLESAYRTSPYFEYYEDDLKPLFFNKETSLLDFNLKAFQLICELLDMEIDFTFSKEYFKNPEQTDLRYLTNPKLKTNFNLKNYNQVLNKNNEFHSNLSILDLLFNEGPNAVSYMENQNFLL